MIGFTVNGTTYSTGVNDALLTTNSVNFVAGTYKALKPTPLATKPTPESSLVIGLARDLPAPAPVPFTNPDQYLTYLDDGPNGLELATALFNSPAQKLLFPVIIPASADLAAPYLVTTLVGSNNKVDKYRFVDSNGATIGTEVSVLPSGGDIATFSWIYYRVNGTLANGPGGFLQAPGENKLRMRVYNLSDFQVPPNRHADIAALELALNGESDISFVAYNTKLLPPAAPDMAIDLSGMPAVLSQGAPYSGSFTCTNKGAAAASAVSGAGATSCQLADLPAGLSVKACTLDGVAWAPGAAVPPSKTVLCTVEGTPSAPGNYTSNGSTSGTSRSTVAGTDIDTPDSDLSNNNAQWTSTVLPAPDMAIDVSSMGTTMTQGTPYSGTYTCRNIGQGNASAGSGTSCVVSALPAGLTQICTISTPIAGTPWSADQEVPASATVTCSVSGTPTTPGPVAASGSTSGSNVTVVNSASYTTPDIQLSNNTALLTFNVLPTPPDMQVDSIDLPPAQIGSAYSGSFSCSNHGVANATTVRCSMTGLPSWATVQCAPATPVASLAGGVSIACTVSGTPSSSADKGSFPVTASTSAATESDTSNNTRPATLIVNGKPMVVIDLSGLPSTGTVNQPYSGAFTCTNNGTADASAITCSANLAPWMTMGACTITPGGSAWSTPGDIPEGQAVTCPVTGTPQSAGTVTVDGTGGEMHATKDVKVNGGAAAAATAVPTLSQWGLILLASLIAACGLLVVRRTR